VAEDRPQADPEGSADILVNPVPDEDGVGWGDPKPVQGELKDGRVGLAPADLRREGEHVEAVAQAELLKPGPDKLGRVHGVGDEPDFQAPAAEFGQHPGGLGGRADGIQFGPGEGFQAFPVKPAG